MNWIYYILEANLYLVAFYLMYKLLLAGTTFYNANRYFLICSIVVASTIPLLQVGFLKPQALITPEFEYYDIPIETLEIKPIEKQSALQIEDYVVYAYIALSVCLGLKFLLAIAKIIKLYFANRKHKSGKYTLVELPNEQSAFSFFNVLFIHPSMAKNDAILTHEKIHIREKHSFDIVLLELLKIICWFNPIVYFIKNDLRLLHEYIADENTTATIITKHEYAMFLIENSIGAFSPSLVNQFFNQSILKSRINMLNKEKTANWARLKYLLAVPLGGALLCVSTLAFSKSYGYLELFPEQVNAEQVLQKVTTEAELAKTGRYGPSYVYDENDNYKSLEKRLIVINGVAIKDNNKYYGSNNADKILFLNAKEATNKYGTKGKYGAVEIYGRKSVLTYQPPYVIADTAKFPAPKMQASGTPALSPTRQKVKKDQIKFPPTYKPKNQKSFFSSNVYKDKKAINLDKRLIVLNGEAVKDNSTFHGVDNVSEVIILSREDAKAKYGNNISNGAVEINGTNVRKLSLKAPPPIETPAVGTKLKKIQPTNVNSDKKATNTNSAKLVEEIELVQLGLSKNEKTQVIEVIPAVKPEEIEIKKVNKSRLELKPADKIERLEIDKIKQRTIPSKKVQKLKLTPSISIDKTVALITNASQSNNKSKVITVNALVEKTNNVFTKAWTLYKPKAEDNKNDKC